jgi:hypothetical protein
MSSLSANMDFINLAKAGVAHGFCQPPAKAGGNSILLKNLWIARCFAGGNSTLLISI